MNMRLSCRVGNLPARLATPLVGELPLVCCFLYLMGGLDCLKSLVYALTLGHDWTVALGCLRRLSVWFLMTYLLVLLVTLAPAKWPRRVMRSLVYAATLLLFGAQQFLSVNFNTLITPSILTMVAETNAAESGEFVTTYLFNSPSCALYLRLGLMTVGIIFLEWAHRRFLRQRLKSVQNWAGWLLMPLLAVCVYNLRIYAPLLGNDTPDRTRAALLYVEGTAMDLPSDPVTQLARSVILLHQAGNTMRLAVDRTREVEHQRHVATDSVNIILVIGESYIKSHSQLYGYSLPTAPRLHAMQQSGSLSVFTDAVTPYNSTSTAMKHMLCCNSVGDGEPWYESVFFPAVFKRAGYDVYFWDNQRDCMPTAEFSFSLNSFIYNPELLSIYRTVNQKSFDYDGDLIESYFATKPHGDTHANLIIFHLIGQHINAAMRFPHRADLVRFGISDYDRNEPWMTDEKRQAIADYDNATYYNDAVVADIISRFDNDNAVLIYLSDHGDEIFDFRDKQGRDHSAVITDSCAKYQYEIPFMVWCSDAYQKSHPDLIAALCRAQDKPFMSDNLCQLMFALAGIETPYYKPKRDPLSSGYECPPRIIGDRADYDKVRSRDTRKKQTHTAH